MATAKQTTKATRGSKATKASHLDLPQIDPKVRAALKAEIAQWGRLVLPVVQDENGNVIDGKTRLEIARELGIKDVLTHTVPGLSARDRERLRISLNTLRRHLTRKQVQEWLRSEILAHPTHSDRMIAGRVGCSPTTVGTVRRTVQVDTPQKREGKDGRFRRVPVIPTARATRLAEVQKFLREQPEIESTQPAMSLRSLRSQHHELRRQKLIENAKPVTLADFQVFTRSFVNCKAVIPDHSVDLVIVDPPWMEWKQLAEKVGREIRRILKPNGFACVYCGNPTLMNWHQGLSKSLQYEWTLSAQNQTTNAFYHGAIQQRHLPILLYRSQPNGQFRTFRPLVDVLKRGPAEKTHHEWQQHVSDSVSLILSLSKPGDLVCDLTCGSGTVGVAVAQAGERRRFVGVEIDPQTANLARSRIAEAVANKENRSARADQKPIRLRKRRAAHKSA